METWGSVRLLLSTWVTPGAGRSISWGTWARYEVETGSSFGRKKHSVPWAGPHEFLFYYHRVWACLFPEEIQRLHGAPGMTLQGQELMSRKHWCTALACKAIFNVWWESGREKSNTGHLERVCLLLGRMKTAKNFFFFFLIKKCLLEWEKECTLNFSNGRSKLWRD